MAEEEYVAGEQFPAFPYPPYDIQLGFMQALYKALDKGGVGLFESPTGTGKTLSLICGTLHWLDDYRKREAQLKEEQGNDKQQQDNTTNKTDTNEDDVPDWMKDFASQKTQEREKQIEEKRKERIAKAKAQVTTTKYTSSIKKDASTDDPDDEFLVDDWNSDDEDPSQSKTRKRLARGDALLSDSDSDHEDDAVLGEHELLETPKRLQIMFCSRTHSQLTQFVGELHRTPFADSMSLVALGSRKALCINDEVIRLNNPSLINERCMEMQKPGSKTKKSAIGSAAAPKAKTVSSSGKCAYLGAGSKAADTTRDIILAQPIDIEELAKLGRRKTICPYYAARRAVPEADIILVPYTSLLMKETRDSLGLQVEGNVIIIDEAHNLVDAINGTHSAELTGAVAEAAGQQLQAYLDRFKTRLAPGNAKNIQLLIRVATICAKYTTGDSTTSKGAMTVNDFLFNSGLDNINMFRLVRYIRESKAVFKVAGFTQSQRLRALKAAAANGGDITTDTDPQGSTGALHTLVSFIQALTNEDTDGRIVNDATSKSLKFVLLNAATHFAHVVSQAKAVILASGTLSPLESILHLFPSIASEDIHHFGCGHVVGKERLLALAVGSGPSGLALDFRMESRATHATIDELGRLVINACTAAPGGVVVFFPSFGYADQVYTRWSSTGALKQLAMKKKVFREPRSSGEVDAVLDEYAEVIAAACSKNNDNNAKVVAGLGATTASTTKTSSNNKLTGAVMLCVVGGKLAEGINFGDDLGRLVIMVGLPYPNAGDPELQERLKYIERTVSGAAGREHYQNLCMKAVNQCVGRAIRHRNDYAAIMLVDTRYASGVVQASNTYTGPVAKLPDWIKQSLVGCPKFGDAYGRLVRFYKGFNELND